MSKQEAGRRGGRAQSEKKGAAARANGKLGGRGRKKPKQEPKQPKKRVRIEDLGIPGLRYASELDALSAEDLEATRRELGLD